MTDQAEQNGEQAAAPILGVGSRPQAAGEPSRSDSDGRPDTQLHAEPEVDTDDGSRAREMVTSTIGSPSADTPAAAGEAAADSNQTNRAIAEYMLRIDDGEQVDREQFLAEHPEDAAALRQYFAGLDAIRTQLSAVPASKVSKSGLLPEFIGRYRIDGLLGQGGMGLVLRAEHPRMKRSVALKVLSPKLVRTPEALRRFQREVEAAARLTHPNIVTAYDADEADGTHFLVMEYVEGSDLSALVRKHGPLALSRALDCILQAARGLQHAHEHGVVHRDIKPANLLLDRSGTVKILDMGLARLDSFGGQQDELTGTGQTMGTVDYMAPEQARNSKLVDVRADIYSLGATLWYLLTGRPLYAGETTVEKLMSHQTKPIPSLRSVCPEVSPPLDAVFRRMVAKTPAERYGTMAEVIADLEPFRGWLPHSSSASTKSGIGVATAPVARPAAARSRWRDWRILTATGAGGLLLVLLGIWLIVRDKEGNEVARVRLPEGGSVVQEPDRPAAQPSAPTAESAPAAVKAAPLPPWTLPPGAPPPAVAPFNAVQAKKHQAAWAEFLRVPVEFENSIGMKFMLIPPGEFDMGSTEEEVAELLELAEAKKQPSWYRDRLPAEAPMHHVRITRPFYLGTNEATQAQYEAVMKANPSKCKDDPAHPVEMVTWHDATDFCRKLSELSEERVAHAEYRLPTEAEWEYACRSGTTTRWYSGDNEPRLMDVAWYGSISGKTTHPAGQKMPNAWGLRDVHGNVFEWCQDWFYPYYYRASPLNDPPGPVAGSDRVIRGGRSGADAFVAGQLAATGITPTTAATTPAFAWSVVSLAENPLHKVLSRSLATTGKVSDSNSLLSSGGTMIRNFLLPTWLPCS